jgi:transitional endoplasmic reticulum ATPase
MQSTSEENNKKGIKIRVGEIPSSAQKDIGIGIIRIDAKAMQTLGIREGDSVEIEGKRTTGAIALRAYPSDSGIEVIRMDGHMRRNAGTGIGEYVYIRKANIIEAKIVTLAPAEKGILLQMSGDQLRKILNNRLVKKGDIIIPSNTQKRKSIQPDLNDILDLEEMFGGFGFGEIRLIVTKTEPKNEICKITELTKVNVLNKAVDVEEDEISTTPQVTYEDVGGIKDEVKKVREMIELPLKHPEIFHKLGIEPPKGVLLHGPPGTGKTLLARAVAAESNVKFYSIAGPEIISKFYGESEQNLRNIFKEAEENGPSIIFIDEIDSIAPKRGDTGEVEKRVVAQLLALMDGLNSRGEVVVIAATNIPNAIDPALRRPGRFDREIEIGVPNRDGREEILLIHTRNMPITGNVNIKEIADRTHGYVGADLQSLCKEAAMSTLRRILPDIDLKKDEIPKEILEKIQVTNEDFNEAQLLVEPSAMREVLVEIPKVNWEDVGGLKEAKQYLNEMVEWPLKHPEAFKRMGIKPPRGIILYGLPGTGKTLTAKAVANESKANFISIKGPSIFNKYVGESEKAIREIFKKAKQVAPSIIFIDEIESIAAERGKDDNNSVNDKVVNQMLVEMDGLEGLDGVVIIAATNRPDLLDTALLRPGRLDRHVYIPTPDNETREKIFEIHLKNMPLEKDVKIKELIERTNNYVGADIESICREAAISALRKDIKTKKVKMSDFEHALEKVKPTVTKQQIENYHKEIVKSKIKQDNTNNTIDESYYG